MSARPIPHVLPIVSTSTGAVVYGLKTRTGEVISLWRRGRRGHLHRVASITHKAVDHRLPKLQAHIYTKLLDGPVTMFDLSQYLGGRATSAVSALERKGLIQVTHEPVNISAFIKTDMRQARVLTPSDVRGNRVYTLSLPDGSRKTTTHKQVVFEAWRVFWDSPRGAM